MAIRRIKLSDLLFGGALAPASLQAEAPAAPASPAAAPSLSILRTLNALCRRLEQALSGLREHASADTELRALAGELLYAVRRDPDIALAAVLLNQVAGSYGVRHCLESAIVALLVAQQMGKSDPELVVIAAAALTMNVGMVRQCDIFHGREGGLTQEERALVRRHPHDSVDLLRWAGIVDEEWLSYVLLHHECEDGSGYPEGRMGRDIAENAKLIGAADRYCAMVSARNYRRSLPPPVAMGRIAGELAQAFRLAIGEHPPGTLVRLQNGEMGVVAGRVDEAETLEVCILRGADGVALGQPVHRFSSEAGCAVEEALHEDDARLRFTMQQVWGELAAL